MTKEKQQYRVVQVWYFEAENSVDAAKKIPKVVKSKPDEQRLHKVTRY